MKLAFGFHKRRDKLGKIIIFKKCVKIYKGKGENNKNVQKYLCNTCHSSLYGNDNDRF
jgi:hypothetical protein